MEAGGLSLRAEIKEGLSLHFTEMGRCESSGCYWALLHLVVIIPDICGALETEDGRASPDSYEGWCRRYLVDRGLDGWDWYHIRCKVLHQGQTLADPSAEHGSFRFQSHGPHNVPYLPGARWPGNKTHLLLNIVEMAREIRLAVEKWVEALEQIGPEGKRQQVRKHLATIATMDRNTMFDGVVGVTSMVTGMGVTSPQAPSGPAVAVAKSPVK